MKELWAVIAAIITGLIRQRLDNISTLLMVTSLPAIKELMDHVGSRQV